MDKKFFKRASWFLEEAREGKYPNSTALAEEAGVSVKTASRIIDKLRAEFDAPIGYSANLKGFFLEDPEFRLPLLTVFSKQEVRSLRKAAELLRKEGLNAEAKLVTNILRRGEA